MKVFSNTTPLIALASIQRLDLPPRLFGQIHVTEEVIGECAVGGPVAVPPLRELGWIVLARTPTLPEYMENVKTLESKSAEVYRYMNFNRIAEFQEVADTVTD